MTNINNSFNDFNTINTEVKFTIEEEKCNFENFLDFKIITKLN